MARKRKEVDVGPVSYEVGWDRGWRAAMTNAAAIVRSFKRFLGDVSLEEVAKKIEQETEI